MQEMPPSAVTSSVSEWLFRNVVVFFISMVHKFDSLRVLPPCKWFLPFLIRDEGLHFINIVSFTISESQMVPFIQSPPHRGEQIRYYQEKQLRHVENVQELSTVPHIKPHPISI